MQTMTRFISSLSFCSVHSRTDFFIYMYIHTFSTNIFEELES